MDAPHGRAVGRAGVRRESSEAALVVVMGDETAPPPLPLAAAVGQRTTSAPPTATAPRHRQRCRIEIEMTEKHRPDCVHGTLKKEQLHCHHPTAVVGTNGSVVIKERIDIDYCDDSGDDHRRLSDDWEGAAARPEAGAGAAAPGPGVAVRPSRKGLRLNDEGSFHQPPQEDRAEVERAPLLGRPTDEIAPASANIWEKSEPALLMAATTGQPIIISANTEQPLIISTPAEQPVIISCMHDKSPCHKAPSRNHAPGPSTCPIESKDPPPIEQSPPTKNEQNANDPAKDFVWETPKSLVLNVSNPKLRVSFARNLEEESAAKPAVNDGQKGEREEDRRSVLKRSSHDLSTGAASPSDYLSATLGRGQSIPSAGTVAAASSSAAHRHPPAQPPPPPPPNSVVSAAPAKASTHQSNTYPSSRVQYYYAMSQNSHDSIFSKEAQDASFPAGLQPTRLLTTTADARGAESTASAGMDIIRQITAYTVEPPRVILQQPARAPLLRDDTPLGKAVASKLSAPVTISAVGAEDDSTETSVELGSTSLGASASPPLSPDSASVAGADASQHIRAQARAAFAEVTAGRAGIERAPGGYLDPVPGWRTYPEARTNYFGAGAPGAGLSSSESDWERERGRTLFLRRAPLRASVTAEGRAARRSRDPTLDLTPSLERDPSPATTAAVSAASGLSVEQAALKLRMQDPCWVTAPMVRAALERRRAEKAAAEGAWRRREERAQRQRERQAEAERARAERHLLLEQARQRAEDRDLERARRKQATWIKLKSDPCWDEPPVQFKVPSTGGMREGAAAAAPDDSSLAVTLPPDDTTTTSEESSVVSSGDRPVVRRVSHANLSRTNVVAFVPAKLTATPFSVAAEGRATSLLQPSSSQSAAYAPDALQPPRAYTHVVVVQDNPPSEAAEAVGGRASKAKLAAAAAVAAVAATATQAAGAAEAGAKALADAVRGHSADASPHRRALTTVALSEAPPAPPTPAPAPEPAARGEGPQPSCSHAEKARAAAKPSKALRREQRARKLESERGGVRETSSDELGAPGGEATSQPAAGAARHIWPAANSSSVVLGAAVHVRRDATRPHAEAPPPPPPLKAQPSPVLAPPPPPPLAPPLAPPPPPTALPQSLRRPQSPPAKPGAPAAATDSIIVVELKPAQVDLVSAASPAEKAEPETDVQKKKKKKKRKEQKKHERERRERGGALRRIWRFLTCRS